MRERIFLRWVVESDASDSRPLNVLGDAGQQTAVLDGNALAGGSDVHRLLAEQPQRAEGHRALRGDPRPHPAVEAHLHLDHPASFRREVDLGHGADLDAAHPDGRPLLQPVDVGHQRLHVVGGGPRGSTRAADVEDRDREDHEAGDDHQTHPQLGPAQRLLFHGSLTG